MAVMMVKAATTLKVAAAVTLKTAALMVTMAVRIERMAAVYRRGRWFVSNVSDVRIMWNITPPKIINPARKTHATPAATPWEITPAPQL
jgi:hypothetical protein